MLEGTSMMSLLVKSGTEMIINSSPSRIPGDAYEDMLYVAIYEELFPILYENHGPEHVRAYALHKIVREKYCNIPREVIKDFCRLCPLCIEKNTKIKKPVPGHTPIVTDGFGERVQIDLVDMRAMECGGFNYILTCCDHHSKFGYATALRNKTANCVARALLHYFSIIGVPAYVQTDNGGEFFTVANEHGENIRVQREGIDDDVND